MMSINTWTINSAEKDIYENQFKLLNPVNENLQGENVKRFFMLSKLPANTLGMIWELSDANCDGKLNINEFMVACKLIQLKLRGVNIPAVLPSPLANVINYGYTFPVDGISPTPISVVASNVTAGQSLDDSSLLQNSLYESEKNKISSPTDNLTTKSENTYIPVALCTQFQSTLPTSIIDDGAPTYAAMQPTMPILPQLQSSIVTVSSNNNINLTTTVDTNNFCLDGNAESNSANVSSNNGNVYTQQQTTITTTNGLSTMMKCLSDEEEKKNTVISCANATASNEWAVPHQVKLKYTQLFNAQDKNRTGFITGIQARYIMTETKLPYSVLAEIFRLADLDADGKFSCEEFILAMYMCEMAKSGQTIPVPLPSQMIPPTFKRRDKTILATAASSNNSVSNSTEAARLVAQSSFEDKRKENFEMGQAELEKRRKALLELQMSENEEKLLSLSSVTTEEQCTQKSPEKEKYAAIQSDTLSKEEQPESNAVKLENTLISCLKEKIRQEKLKISKLTDDDKKYMGEFEGIIKTILHLSKNIDKARSGVTEFKGTIDKMKLTRDCQMEETVVLKQKVKHQNQLLININQEKHYLDSKNKMNTQQRNNTNVVASIDTSCNAKLLDEKQANLTTMRDKIKEIQVEITNKKQNLTAVHTHLENMNSYFKNVLNDCTSLYAIYTNKQNMFLEMKNQISTTLKWYDDVNSSEQQPERFNEKYSQAGRVPHAPVTGYIQYRAIYKFTARNDDELSFQPGDYIMVNINHDNEPGWLFGNLNDLSGWFPESYVHCIERENVASDFVVQEPSADDETVSPSRPLEKISEVPEVISSEYERTENDKWDDVSNDNDYETVSIHTLALQSSEAKDESQLNFCKGDIIYVTRKKDLWYYGEIKGCSGWFPISCVMPFSNSRQASVDQQSDLYIAVYPYESNEPGDLCFPQNSIIQVIKKDGDWWTGLLDGKEGIFPSNFIKKLPPSLEPATSPAAAVVAAEFGKLSIARVIAPYEATGAEQLTLEKDQLVIIRKKNSTGWWEGEIREKMKKRKVGWFPASYVKCLPVNNQNNNIVAIASNYTAADISPTDSSERSFDEVVALYKYSALNSDELSFDKDDIIKMIAKEEPHWWKGEFNGVLGLFPSNYVTPIYK